MSEQKRIATVSELSRYLAGLFANHAPLHNLTVSGEISGCKYQMNGNCYFTLKDEKSVLPAVIFAKEAQKIPFVLENGMKVFATGDIGVYEIGGRYQMYAQSIEPDGIGALYIAYEQLKKRLEKEGLFAETHKKPIPKLPRRVGVITSRTGAVLHDIQTVSERRFPFAEILLYPSAVQGEDAPRQLIAGIDYFSRTRVADVVIIGRGGGSVEDLWCFNDEGLARAIYACPVPVVSAVGHETDVTICDWVADKRAATPSAAAEIVFPDKERVKTMYKNLLTRCNTDVEKKCKAYQDTLDKLAHAPALQSPVNTLNEKQMHLMTLTDSLTRAEEKCLNSAGRNLAAMAGKLEALNPLSVLSRGYSVVSKSDGGIVRGIADLHAGEQITVKFADGEAVSTVNSINEKGK